MFFIAIKLEKKCSDVSPLTLEEIMELAKNHNATEIAGKLGISRQYLYKFLKKHDVKLPKQSKKVEIDVTQFSDLYQQGLSDSVIAKTMKISRSKVIRVRQEMGLEANLKVGERGPGKLRDNALYIDEVRRILRDSKTARIIHTAARTFRRQGGDEKLAWAATLIEPATIYHPDIGPFCTAAEKTNLTGVKYAVEFENKQDFAGLCGLPSIQLVEQALEARQMDQSQLDAITDTLAGMVAYSGYMGTHITTKQAREISHGGVNEWNEIWNTRMQESMTWAPVQKESKKRVTGYSEVRASNGKKGKGGGVQNIETRRAYLGVAGY